MKKILIVASICLITQVTVYAQSGLDKLKQAQAKGRTAIPLTGKFSEKEAGEAIKQALEKGAEFAVSKGSAENGYLNNPLIRIPFPEEANEVKKTALNLGLNKQVEDFEKSLNKAAELAAKEALEVLKNAVTGLTLQEAIKLVNGNENAATNYLETNTRNQIKLRFQPIIDNSLQQANVEDYWDPLAKAYNKTTLFSGKQKVEPDLSNFVTERALNGLFLMLAEEEKNIRNNPLARSSDLLKKVFGSN